MYSGYAAMTRDEHNAADGCFSTAGSIALCALEQRCSMPLIQIIVVLIVVGVLSFARQSLYTDGRIT